MLPFVTRSGGSPVNGVGQTNSGFTSAATAIPLGGNSAFPSSASGGGITARNRDQFYTFGGTSGGSGGPAASHSNSKLLSAMDGGAYAKSSSSNTTGPASSYFHRQLGRFTGDFLGGTSNPDGAQHQLAQQASSLHQNLWPIFAGCIATFSGFVPKHTIDMHLLARYKDVWQRLGGRVSEDLTTKTTHLFVVRGASTKCRAAWLHNRSAGNSIADLTSNHKILLLRPDFIVDVERSVKKALVTSSSVTSRSAAGSAGDAAAAAADIQEQRRATTTSALTMMTEGEWRLSALPELIEAHIAGPLAGVAVCDLTPPPGRLTPAGATTSGGSGVAALASSLDAAPPVSPVAARAQALGAVVVTSVEELVQMNGGPTLVFVPDGSVLVHSAMERDSLTAADEARKTRKDAVVAAAAAEAAAVANAKRGGGRKSTKTDPTPPPPPPPPPAPAPKRRVGRPSNAEREAERMAAALAAEGDAGGPNADTTQGPPSSTAVTQNQKLLRAPLSFHELLAASGAATHLSYPVSPQAGPAYPPPSFGRGESSAPSVPEVRGRLTSQSNSVHENSTNTTTMTTAPSARTFAQYFFHPDLALVLDASSASRPLPVLQADLFLTCMESLEWTLDHAIVRAEARWHAESSTTLRHSTGVTSKMDTGGSRTATNSAVPATATRPPPLFITGDAANHGAVVGAPLLAERSVSPVPSAWAQQQNLPPPRFISDLEASTGRGNYDSSDAAGGATTSRPLSAIDGAQKVLDPSPIDCRPEVEGGIVGIWPPVDPPPPNGRMINAVDPSLSPADSSYSFSMCPPPPLSGGDVSRTMAATPLDSPAWTLTRSGDAAVDYPISVVIVAATGAEFAFARRVLSAVGVMVLPCPTPDTTLALVGSGPVVAAAVAASVVAKATRVAGNSMEHQRQAAKSALAAAWTDARTAIGELPAVSLLPWTLHLVAAAAPGSTSTSARRSPLGDAFMLEKNPDDACIDGEPGCAIDDAVDCGAPSENDGASDALHRACSEEAIAALAPSWNLQACAHAAAMNALFIEGASRVLDHVVSNTVARAARAALGAMGRPARSAVELERMHSLLTSATLVASVSTVGIRELAQSGLFSNLDAAIEAHDRATTTGAPAVAGYSPQNCSVYFPPSGAAGGLSLGASLAVTRVGSPICPTAPGDFAALLTGNASPLEFPTSHPPLSTFPPPPVARRSAASPLECQPQHRLLLGGGSPLLFGDIGDDVQDTALASALQRVASGHFAAADADAAAGAVIFSQAQAIPASQHEALAPPAPCDADGHSALDVRGIARTASGSAFGQHVRSGGVPVRASHMHTPPAKKQRMVVESGGGGDGGGSKGGPPTVPPPPLLVPDGATPGGPVRAQSGTAPLKAAATTAPVVLGQDENAMLGPPLSVAAGQGGGDAAAGCRDRPSPALDDAGDRSVTLAMNSSMTTMFPAHSSTAMLPQLDETASRSADDAAPRPITTTVRRADGVETVGLPRDAPTNAAAAPQASRAPAMISLPMCKDPRVRTLFQETVFVIAPWMAPQCARVAILAARAGGGTFTTNYDAARLYFIALRDHFDGLRAGDGRGLEDQLDSSNTEAVKKAPRVSARGFKGAAEQTRAATPPAKRPPPPPPELEGRSCLFVLPHTTQLCDFLPTDWGATLGAATLAVRQTAELAALLRAVAIAAAAAPPSGSSAAPTSVDPSLQCAATAAVVTLDYLLYGLRYARDPRTAPAIRATGTLATNPSNSANADGNPLAMVCFTPVLAKRPPGPTFNTGGGLHRTHSFNGGVVVGGSFSLAPPSRLLSRSSSFADFSSALTSPLLPPPPFRDNNERGDDAPSVPIAAAATIVPPPRQSAYVDAPPRPHALRRGVVVGLLLSDDRTLWRHVDEFANAVAALGGVAVILDPKLATQRPGAAAGVSSRGAALASSFFAAAKTVEFASAAAVVGGAALRSDTVGEPKLCGPSALKWWVEPPGRACAIFTHIVAVPSTAAAAGAVSAEEARARLMRTTHANGFANGSPQASPKRPRVRPTPATVATSNTALASPIRSHARQEQQQQEQNKSLASPLRGGATAPSSVSKAPPPSGLLASPLATPSKRLLRGHAIASSPAKHYPSHQQHERGQVPAPELSAVAKPGIVASPSDRRRARDTDGGGQEPRNGQQQQKERHANHDDSASVRWLSSAVASAIVASTRCGRGNDGALSADAEAPTPFEVVSVEWLLRSVQAGYFVSEVTAVPAIGTCGDVAAEDAGGPLLRLLDIASTARSVRAAVTVTRQSHQELATTTTTTTTTVDGANNDVASVPVAAESVPSKRPPTADELLAFLHTQPSR